jgi:A/G-specific adenine glycosylase
LEEFRKALTVWYNHSKRDLPWRGSTDPYKIWISEVIMQQTRVLQGMVYYHDFLQSFKDIKSLALASEEEVLKVWQGLGYYTRARNMHLAARTIMSEYGGKFPSDYPAIRKLKGIGDYTAAAIASIAYGLPYAVVDGNVFRVLSRIFGISTPIDTSTGKKEFYKLARLLLDTDNPGEFNQALMEFGAIQCLPKQPRCSGCPLSLMCHAFANQSIANFPVKSIRVKIKVRYLNYLYLHQAENFFLEKRSGKDIWRNMYQFPLIETLHPATNEEIICSEQWKTMLFGLSFTIESVSAESVHLLTHQRLNIRFFSVRLEDRQLPEQLIRIGQTDLARFPVPKPVENFLRQMGH